MKNTTKILTGITTKTCICGTILTFADEIAESVRCEDCGIKWDRKNGRYTNNRDHLKNDAHGSIDLDLSGNSNV